MLLFRSEEKLEIARKMGMTDCINAKDEDSVELVMRETKSRGVDLVFDSAGSKITFEQSMRMARKLGKVVIVGLVEEDVTLPRETVLTILRHELTIYGVYNTDTKPIPLNSWQTSLHFIEARRLDVKSLITHRFKIEDIATVFKNMAREREKFNKVIFVF